MKMAGGELPAGWSSHIHASEGALVDARKGSNRCDLACAQAGNLLRHAKQVSLKHLENQVMREVLRLRPEPVSDRRTFEHRELPVAELEREREASPSITVTSDASGELDTNGAGPSSPRTTENSSLGRTLAELE